MIRAGLLVFSKQYREKTHYDPLFELFFRRRDRPVLQDQRRTCGHRTLVLTWLDAKDIIAEFVRSELDTLVVPDFGCECYKAKESPLLIIARLEINAFYVRKHGV